MKQAGIFGVRDIDYLQDLFQIDPKVGFTTAGGTLCVWRFWDGKPANRAEVVLKRNSIELYVGELTQCYEEIAKKGEPYMCMSLKHSQFEIALRFNTMQTAEPILNILLRAYHNEDSEEDVSMVSKDEVMQLVNSAVEMALKKQLQETGAKRVRIDKDEYVEKGTSYAEIHKKPQGSENPAKERFEALVKKQGYRSMRSFANACGISAPNLASTLNGRCGLSIERAFTFANVLGINVDDVIEAFYPELMEENRKAIGRVNKYVENDVEDISDEDLFKEEFF